MIIPPVVELGGRLWLVKNWKSEQTNTKKLILESLEDTDREELEEMLMDAYVDVLGRLFKSMDTTGESSDANNDAN